jgi:hypothetical protein
VRDESVVEDGKGSPASATVGGLVDTSDSQTGDADEDSRGSGGGLGGIIEGHPGETDLVVANTAGIYLVCKTMCFVFRHQNLPDGSGIYVPPSGNAVTLAQEAPALVDFHRPLPERAPR